MLHYFARAGDVFLLLLVAVFLTFLTLALRDERSTSHYDSSHTNAGFRARVIYSSRLAQFVRWLSRGSIYAIPLWNRVYFAPGRWSVGTAARAHELVHVDQWHRLGPVRFIYTYLRDLIRFGYIHHPLEVEARRDAQESLGTV